MRCGRQFSREFRPPIPATPVVVGTERAVASDELSLVRTVTLRAVGSGPSDFTSTARKGRPNFRIASPGDRSEHLSPGHARDDARTRVTADAHVPEPTDRPHRPHRTGFSRVDARTGYPRRSTLRISQLDGVAPPRPCLPVVSGFVLGPSPRVLPSVTIPGTPRLLWPRPFRRRPGRSRRSFVEDSMVAPRPNSLDGRRRRRLRLPSVTDVLDSDIWSDRPVRSSVYVITPVYQSGTSHINYKMLYEINHSPRNSVPKDG